jgi:hypothetical protein
MFSEDESVYSSLISRRENILRSCRAKCCDFHKSLEMQKDITHGKDNSTGGNCLLG